MGKDAVRLRREGPLPVTAFDDTSFGMNEKANGLTTFVVPGFSTASPYTLKHPTAVAYLRDEHTKLSVLKTWLEANEEEIEDVPNHVLRGRLREQGQSWHAAIDALLPPDGDGSGGEGGNQGSLKPCPFCGEEVHSVAWPGHIADCA